MTAPIIFTCLGICLGVLLDWATATIRARAGRDDIMAIADAISDHPGLTAAEAAWLDRFDPASTPDSLRVGARIVADDLRKRTRFPDAALCSIVITLDGALGSVLVDASTDECTTIRAHAARALFAATALELAAAPLADPAAAAR